MRERGPNMAARSISRFVATGRPFDKYRSRALSTACLLLPVPFLPVNAKSVIASPAVVVDAGFPDLVNLRTDPDRTHAGQHRACIGRYEHTQPHSKARKPFRATTHPGGNHRIQAVQAGRDSRYKGSKHRKPGQERCKLKRNLENRGNAKRYRPKRWR